MRRRYYCLQSRFPFDDVLVRSRDICDQLRKLSEFVSIVLMSVGRQFFERGPKIFTRFKKYIYHRTFSKIWCLVSHHWRAYQPPLAMSTRANTLQNCCTDLFPTKLHSRHNSACNRCTYWQRLRSAYNSTVVLSPQAFHASSAITSAPPPLLVCRQRLKTFLSSCLYPDLLIWTFYCCGHWNSMPH